MSLSVVIAEDRLMIRDSLRIVLETAGFHVIAAVERAREAVMLARTATPDILLYAGSESLDAIELGVKIRHYAPRCRVVVLAEAVREIEGSLAAGIRGYVLWKQEAAQVVWALREVAAGAVHLCPDAKAMLAAGAGSALRA